MGKLESYGAGLLPVAIIAGILSGSFFKPAPVAQTATQAPKPPVATQPPEDGVRTAWLADLRPVMEAMGDAMGLPVQRDSTVRLASLTLKQFEDPQPADVTKAIATIREGLNRHDSDPDPRACNPDSPTGSVGTAEQTLIGYLLAEDAGSSSRKLRSSLAEATLNELQDWRALGTLARNVPSDGRQGPPRYRATFIVATVPDYVDSVAGWTADQSLAAIQSAMSRSGYLLDRFRLVDWARNDPHSENPVASDSRLHERQPGALIFRHQDGDTIELGVVLLALETPTSGVHRTALRNAIRFIREWNRCAAADAPDQELRVLGPTFSGSSLSVALTLRDLGAQDLAAFTNIRVMSGSATADENASVFRAIAPRNTSFQAALPPTSETRRIMADYLGRMNPDWLGGANVAILLESNTVYGQTPRKFAEQLKRDRDASPGDGVDVAQDPFEKASVFSFPMHLSQLRNDTSDSPASAPSLLPTSAVPLNMRETTPPADLIPALRPQLTSPVVESTVDTILDTIRHKRLTAVGIQATDDRDVLFLAREVKRAAPDVQLFFLGAHALYLHQDYVPYLRGTLVASPYPLSLTTQAGFAGAGTKGREPFQSMAAEGLFNATLLLLKRNVELLDYCDSSPIPETRCMPHVAISVIGEDGFWPLAGVGRTHPVLERASDQDERGPQVSGSEPITYSVKVSETFEPQGLPPFPTRARIVVTLLATFVLAQVLMVLAIGRQLRRRASARSFLEWPVLRVLVPPVTYPSAAALHRFSLLMSFVILGLLFAWIAAVAVPFISSAHGDAGAVVVTVLAAAVVLVPALLLISQGTEATPRHWPELAKRKSSWMLMPALVLLMLTIGAFVWYLAGLVRAEVPDDLNLTLARLVGGGIVSPAPATLCLLAGLYTAMFAAMRRLSLVGNGYTRLEDGSTAFNLLNGVTDAGEAPRTPTHRARLGDILDMPSQNLPLTYVIGILLGIVIAGFIVGKVSTIDGRAFEWFLSFASVTVLMLGLMNLAQGLAIWNTARAHLKWLALSPMEGAFKSVASLVPWDVSVGPPRVMELMPVAQRADGIIGKLRLMAGRTEQSSNPPESEGPSDGPLTEFERRLVEMKLGIRRGDLDAQGKRGDVTSNVRLLEREMGQQQHAALVQSPTWMHLWKVSDAVVEILRASAWRRIAPERHRAVAPAAVKPTVVASVSVAESGAAEAGITTPASVTAVVEAPGGSSTEASQSAGVERGALFQQCEEFVALQFAFVLRDIVARTVAALFTAMLCMTLLTAAHLLYSFNPRSSLLTVDLLAVTGAALTSIWILVSMEREPVLSRLRNTTPGRVDLNWTFVQRVAVYGVLPLVAVLASLFPEIGGSIFGWLEPLQKLMHY